MKRILPALFIILTLVSCSKSGSKKIYIASTTDVHGMIFGLDPSTGSENRYSMSKVATFLNTLDRNELVLLDNGDNLQGTPSVYYYNFEDVSSPHIWSEVMNYLNYDAITVGNHDIETGHDVYDRIKTQFNAPLLAANAIDTETGEPYFEAYTIIRKNGVKIAVLGLITPGIPGWLPEVLYSGIEFEDMLESAKKWMPIILEEKPDIVVGLFHAGWNESYGGGEVGSYMNQNASLSVAREVDGFDLIIIGHDHDLMNDYLVNNSGDSILILDGGSHARFVSLAEIDLVSGKESKIVKICGRQVKTDTLAADNDFDKEFYKDYNIVADYINRPIGRLEKTLSSQSSYFGDSEFMDLIHKIQMETSGADISFAAPLSFDVKIDSGTLKVSDMFELYRFENMLYTIELSGKEIDSYLEYSSMLWFNTLKSPSDKLLKYREGSNTMLLNRSYNFDSASGIDYTVDLTKDDGMKVNIIGFSDGRSFSADSLYTVALNSYRGSGGGGHLSRGCNLSDDDIDKRFVSSTDKDLRYYMMKWIENQSDLDIECDNNWKLIPEKKIEKLVSDEQIRLFNFEQNGR